MEHILIVTIVVLAVVFIGLVIEIVERASREWGENQRSFFHAF